MIRCQQTFTVQYYIMRFIIRVRIIYLHRNHTSGYPLHNHYCIVYLSSFHTSWMDVCDYFTYWILFINKTVGLQLFMLLPLLMNLIDHVLIIFLNKFRLDGFILSGLFIGVVHDGAWSVKRFSLNNLFWLQSSDQSTDYKCTVQWITSLVLVPSAENPHLQYT